MCLVYTGKKLVSLQVIGSNSPIYEGIFTNTYSFFPSPNFPIMIAPTQHGFRSLSPIAFQARPPVYALKRAHIRATNLRCAKVSHPDSFILFANLAALFCTRLISFAPDYLSFAPDYSYS